MNLINNYSLNQQYHYSNIQASFPPDLSAHKPSGFVIFGQSTLKSCICFRQLTVLLSHAVTIVSAGSKFLFPFIFYLCNVILSYRVLKMGVGHPKSQFFLDVLHHMFHHILPLQCDTILQGSENGCRTSEITVFFRCFTSYVPSCFL